MLQAGSLRSPENLITIVKLLAREIQTAVMAREIVHKSLVFDHFRNSRLNQTRECSHSAVRCRIAQPQETNVQSKFFSLQPDRLQFQTFSSS